MTCRSRSLTAGVVAGVLSGAVITLSLPLQAGELPAVKASDTNQVAQCATPGRLMAYVRERNPRLSSKYDDLATDYMRHGEELGVRWDYAFFQMLLETGYLTYTGDVRPEQNNFAGLGATGRGARGESFKDVSTGARAHLEHLLMYSGTRVENPVAERTRNIQAWEVLVPWQKSLKGPLTFSQLAKQWAPGSRGYARDVETIAGRFFDGQCNQPDPRPELVAKARPGKGGRQEVAAAAPPSKGQEAAKRAIDVARTEGAGRSGLGAPVADTKVEMAAPVAAKASEPSQQPPVSPKVTLLNAQPVDAGTPPDAPASAAQSEVAAPKSKAGTDQKVLPPQDNAPDRPAAAASMSGATRGLAGKADGKSESAKGGEVEVAALGGAANALAKPEKDKKPQAAAGKCRVFTASYGGEKAIIIKAVADKTINYTVLDVNAGSEKREADAYINAYAKGGEKVGEFGNQSQALEKAFELCPEG